MNLLWLASWYPSKIHPFNGDFIKRHAEALSGVTGLRVIHVVKDEEGIVTKNLKVEEQQTGRLTETIIYYHVKTSWILVNRVLSRLRLHSAYRKAIKRFIEKEGLPDLVHVHTGMHAGIHAVELLKNWNVPFVVTEHWSGFLVGPCNGFFQLPVYVRYKWKRVIERARSVSLVSEVLRKSIEMNFRQKNTVIIPNVVDFSIFFPNLSVSRMTRQFIHISGMDNLKNPESILKAFSIIAKKYPEAELRIFGNKHKETEELVKCMEAKERVWVEGEVSQEVLARHLREAAALILYSKFETFGCVIIEANACGTPVIVSDIPVFHELVTEGRNGLFAEPDHPEALARRMEEVIRHPDSFDHEAIAAVAREKYAYPAVAAQLYDWYKSVLHPSSGGL